ncbi:MAG: hypothetical protein OXS29_16245 [bacterium]|nr:hypothetical protein [bacterium]MDE0287728.1 hypothetical protein [bacterium]MDE0438134.1 hypothetical protein [bacterium]
MDRVHRGAFRLLGAGAGEVTVSYAKLSTNPLRTSTASHGGSEVEGFMDMPVVNGPPKVESMALSSDPGDHNTYEPGDTVVVQVTFTDVVMMTKVVNRDRQVIRQPGRAVEIRPARLEGRARQEVANLRGRQRNADARLRLDGD